VVHPWDDNQDGYDDWVNDLLKNAPESWDSDEGAESIVTGYVRALERRVQALGGSLERWPDEGPR
jgi:hypothetical protein